MDNRRLDRTIPEIITKAEKAIVYNMRRSNVVSGLWRNDIDEYLGIALRVAIINALGTHIQIRMFTDRLEIENQGGLYGHLSEDTIGIPN